MLTFTNPPSPSSLPAARYLTLASHLLLIGGLFFASSVRPAAADWIIPDGVSRRVDFETTVAGVNQGRYSGAGIGSDPAIGQLDSDTWQFHGFSSGDSAWGQASTSGDLARGLHAGGVTTGGLYAFATTNDNRILGVQATGSDFNPGSMTLAIATEVAQSRWDISFDWYVFNDKPRATKLSAAFSTDGRQFQDQVAAGLTTATVASSAAAWQATGMAFQLDLAVPTKKLWLRWSAVDFAGSGSRDEFGIDNISVRASSSSSGDAPSSTVAEPGGLALWSGLMVGVLALVRSMTPLGRAART